MIDNINTLEIKVKGVVKEDGGWYLETNDKEYSADILSGIDEILDKSNQKCLHCGDELELIIKIQRC